MAKQPKTRRPKRKPPGRNGFRYKEQFGVIVVCDSETHQERVYKVLTGSGYRCRVVVV